MDGKEFGCHGTADVEQDMSRVMLSGEEPQKKHFHPIYSGTVGRSCSVAVMIHRARLALTI